MGAVRGTSEESGSGSRWEPKLEAGLDPAGKDAPLPVWDRGTASVPTPRAEGEREPRWAPEPKPKLRSQLSGAEALEPPRIPDWKPPSPSTSTPEVRWERATQPPFPPRPVHLSTGRGSGPRERSRVVAAIVVLACIVVAGVAIVFSLHHSATATTGSSATTTSGVATSHGTATPPRSSGTSRVQAAVKGADAATTKAQSQLDSLSGFPTPAKVAAVIDPYAYALQLYESFLSGSAVPAAAWSDKITADTQVSEDLRFLNTINELPSLQLGTYMVQFGTVAAQLHTTLSTLEQDLSSSKS